jgi:hypothetical protein
LILPYYKSDATKKLVGCCLAHAPLSQLTIVRRRCSLQYDVKLLTVAFSAMAVVHILYHGRFVAFAIIVVAPTITLKMLVVGWCGLAFPLRCHPCGAVPRHKKCYPRHRFLQ